MGAHLFSLREATQRLSLASTPLGPLFGVLSLACMPPLHRPLKKQASLAKGQRKSRPPLLLSQLTSKGWPGAKGKGPWMVRSSFPQRSPCRWFRTSTCFPPSLKRGLMCSAMSFPRRKFTVNLQRQGAQQWAAREPWRSGRQGETHEREG